MAAAAKNEMRMESPRDTLVQRLAGLLGFEDGASDVLEHLLSIESQEDLLDYLSQLLGQDNQQVRTFVEDVGRFQTGEALSLDPPAALEKADSKPKAEVRTSVTSTTKSSKQKVPAKQKAATKQKAPAAPRNKVQKSENVKMAASTNAISPSITKQTSTNNDKVSKKTHTSPKPPKEAKSIKKSHPPKGKASVVCGCFGTMHKPLTNCLYCGRISCEREGYNFCPFCGLLVENVESGPEGSGEAWRHKERLLRYDRDFARRTVVLDDQEDYFNNQTSTWLTEDERTEAGEKEAQRNHDMHSRQKQKLNLQF